MKRPHDDFELEDETAFYALVRRNPFGLYIVDSEFRLRAVSAGAQSVFASVSPLLGRDFAEILRIIWKEPFASDAIARFRHTLASGESFSSPNTVEERADVETREAYDWRIERIRLPDGSLGVVCYFYDLSERKRWEDSLRESESRFRSMADGLPLLVSVHDARGEQEFVNEAFCTYFGVTQAEMVGARWKDLVHPDDRARSEATFIEAVRARAPFVQEIRVRRADGAWRWIESWGRPRFGADGAYLGHAGISADVTERKAAMDLLRDSDRRKDQFLATLAHELRNPLAPLLTGVDLLGVANPSAAHLQEVRGLLARQVAQLVRLTDDLLDLSRISRGKLVLQKAEVDLAAIIHSAAESCIHLLRDRDFALALPSEVLLHGDPARLVQVFANLLNNACKFTSVGGRIAIRASLAGDHVDVCVEDDGVGIPAESLQSVFDVFVQVADSPHESHGGLGIGLSLVRQIVELHGGHVAAQSAGVGRGTRMIVTLPVVRQRDETAGPRTEAPLLRPAPRGRSVLVVDDNQDAADSLRMLLEAMGHRTRAAYSGSDALRILPHFAPDIIFLDLGMPGMSGIDTLAAMRQDGRHGRARVFALTGWGQEHDRELTRRAGFDGHLIKPVDLAALGKLLEDPGPAVS